MSDLVSAGKTSATVLVKLTGVLVTNTSVTFPDPETITLETKPAEVVKVKGTDYESALHCYGPDGCFLEVTPR